RGADVARFRTAPGRAYLVSYRQPSVGRLSMPVTAKLPQAFYDRLGHEVANQMVDWFNQVDAAYRSDLRELNELNFARFDAKLEQRAAELSARMDQRFGELSAKV